MAGIHSMPNMQGYPADLPHIWAGNTSDGTLTERYGGLASRWLARRIQPTGRGKTVCQIVKEQRVAHEKGKVPGDGGQESGDRTRVTKD